MQVFISYANADIKFVEREVLTLLRKCGIQPWYAKESIQSAECWEKSIRRGLEESEWFLVVLSPKSAASLWVAHEVHWAMENRHDKFVPVLMETCNLDHWHVGLSEIQFVDFRSDLKTARRKFLAVWNGRKTPSPQCDDSSAEQNEYGLISECAEAGSAGGVATATESVPIELVIDQDFDSFTEADQSRLLHAISELLSISGDLHVLRRRRGSVKITLDMEPAQAEALLWAIKRGELLNLNVIDASLLADSPAAITDSSAENGPLELERMIQRGLQSIPGLRFSRLTVHQCPEGVCLEGVLEKNDDGIDLCEFVQKLAGVQAINRVVERPFKPK